MLAASVAALTLDTLLEPSGLAEVLSNDEAVKTLAKRIGNLTLHSYAKEFQGWTLQVDRRFQPTMEDWATIQKIAGYILSSARMF